MVSPEHTDNQKSDNQQAPSPAVKQQVPTDVEKKRVWLMRVLGVVVPLIGGIAIMCLNIYFPDFWALGLLVALLLGAVSALLIRSWWTMLVAPIALALGAWLIASLPIQIGDAGFGVFYTPLITAFGALLGIAIVKKTWRE